MDFVLISLTSLLALNALSLVGIIILQGPQDDSGGAIAAYKTDHMKMIGAAQAPNILEKITRILATLLFVLVLATSYVMKRHYDAAHRDSGAIEQVKTYMISEEEGETKGAE